MQWSTKNIQGCLQGKVGRHEGTQKNSHEIIPAQDRDRIISPSLSLRNEPASPPGPRDPRRIPILGESCKLVYVS
jgi:hypothetical protein